MTSRIPTLLCLLSLSLSAACGGDRERNEAVLLIDRLDSLDTPSDDERRQRVEALSQLPIASPEVAAVRDHCVTMHRALLTSEEMAAGLRGALAGHEDGEPVPAATRRALDEALARSNRALAEARAEGPPCEDGASALRTRFAIPRR